MVFINRIEVPVRRIFGAQEPCNQCLRLAEDADHAGFAVAAEHLVFLAAQALEYPASLTR